MSVTEINVSNPKKTIVFYKDLTEQLQQENKQLKEQSDLYKSVIDEAKIKISELMSRYFYEEDFYIEDTHLDELLEILDKAKIKGEKVMNSFMRGNKGIKGILRVKYNERYLKSIEENKEMFNDVLDRDFNSIQYDMYVATFNEKDDYIVINFNVLDSTFRHCKTTLTKFKKEIYNHFGFKPEQYFIVQYDKI